MRKSVRLDHLQSRKSKAKEEEMGRPLFAERRKTDEKIMVTRIYYLIMEERFEAKMKSPKKIQIAALINILFIKQSLSTNCVSRVSISQHSSAQNPLMASYLPVKSQHNL